MRSRLTALLAAVLVLGACSSSTEEAPEPAQSAAPSAAASTTDTPETAADTDFPRTIEVPAGRDLPATEVTLPAEPARVAALTYETAELVADLGAQERLVMVQEAMANPAISDHAEAMAQIEQHAATEGSIDVEAVIAAQPDLVLLSDRRGLQEGLGQILGEAGIPVLVLPNNWATVADLASNIELVGHALGTDEEAAALSEQIVTGLGEDTDPDGPRVLVLSNQAGQPFVTAGAAFPLELVRLAGGQDASEALGMARTGPISAEQVIAAEPDAILLVDMNGTGEQIFESLLSNAAVAELPAVAQERVLLVEGREVQALGFADTVQARDRIAEWLAQ